MGAHNFPRTLLEYPYTKRTQNNSVLEANRCIPLCTFYLLCPDPSTHLFFLILVPPFQ